MGAAHGWSGVSCTVSNHPALAAASATLLIQGGDFSRRSVDTPSLDRSRQTEAHSIGADCERDELLAADRIGDRRGFDHFVGGKMPQNLAVPLIDGDEVSGRISVE
jgi:hypothetical protein